MKSVIQNPVERKRLIEYPGWNRIRQNPQIVTMTNDPTVQRLWQEQRLSELVRNSVVIAALNDPEVRRTVTFPEIAASLRHATGKGPEKLQKTELPAENAAN